MKAPAKPAQLVLLAAAGAGAFWGAARWSPGSDAAAGVVVDAAPSRAGSAVPAAAPPPRAVASAASAGAPASSAYVLGQRPQAIPDTAGQAFAVLSWLPPPPPPAPPPPPVAPAPPPPPVAPALPFTFVGLLEQGTAKPQAFLAKGDTLLIVAAGDVIENNTYRVESLSAASVVLTYLPMDKAQTLNVSGGATP